MGEQLQKYIISLIDAPVVTNPLDFFTATLLFLPDASLYIGVLGSFMWFGLVFRTAPKRHILYEMIHFCYMASWLGLALLIASSIHIMQVGWEFNWISGITFFNGVYQISVYTQSVKMVVITMNLAFYRLLNAPSSVVESYVPELPLLTHMAITFIFAMISFNHFILLLLALEGFSLILYVFTIVERSFGGVMAGVKYFAFGTLGSLALLWGVAHIYVLMPSLSYKVVFQTIEYLNSATTVEALEMSQAFKFALTLITVGFLIKLGAAPVHQWVADVYAGAPLVITAYYSTIVKFVLFIIFLHIAYFAHVGDLLTHAAIISLFVGCYFALRQQQLKRLLAYSSIVHIAFLLIGDIPGAFTYLLAYVLAGLLVFSVLVSVRVNGREVTHLNDMKYIRQGSLFRTSVLVIAFASMSGLPPFAGFFGKFAIWVSLLEDIYLGSSMSAHLTLLSSMALSLFTIFYYIRILQYTFTGSDATRFTAVTESVSHLPYTILGRNISGFLKRGGSAFVSGDAQVTNEFRKSFSRMQFILAALLLTWVYNYIELLSVIASVSTSLTSL